MIEETTLFDDVKAYRIAHRRLLDSLTETAQATRAALIDGNDAPETLKAEMKARFQKTLGFLTTSLANESETIADALDLLWEIRDELGYNQEGR